MITTDDLADLVVGVGICMLSIVILLLYARSRWESHQHRDRQYRHAMDMAAQQNPYAAHNPFAHPSYPFGGPPAPSANPSWFSAGAGYSRGPLAGPTAGPPWGHSQSAPYAPAPFSYQHYPQQAPPQPMAHVPVDVRGPPPQDTQRVPPVQLPTPTPPHQTRRSPPRQYGFEEPSALFSEQCAPQTPRHPPKPDPWVQARVQPQDVTRVRHFNVSDARTGATGPARPSAAPNTAHNPYTAHNEQPVGGSRAQPPAGERRGRGGWSMDATATFTEDRRADDADARKPPQKVPANPRNYDKPWLRDRRQQPDAKTLSAQESMHTPSALPPLHDRHVNRRPDFW